MIGLALAMLLDAALGEPGWLWSRLRHPAIITGDVIGWADRRFNRGTHRRRNGAMLVLCLIAASFVLGRLIGALPLGALFETLAAAILLAQRSLVDHVADVARGLDDGPAEGRRAVARIVGRDVAGLDEAGVARAAIESAAENLSDGVIAPIFWFALLGLPGMLAYKAINTADSMIGYRTPRHASFGWAAARMDDLVNWLPARLTAVLIFATHMRPGLWHRIPRDAAHHRSPNAGSPEAAMAVALEIALSGPRSYEGVTRDEPFVNPEGRQDIGAGEIARAVAVLWRVWGLTLGLVLVMSYLAS